MRLCLDFSRIRGELFFELPFLIENWCCVCCQCEYPFHPIFLPRNIPRYFVLIYHYFSSRHILKNCTIRHIDGASARRRNTRHSRARTRTLENGPHRHQLRHIPTLHRRIFLLLLPLLQLPRTLPRLWFQRRITSSTHNHCPPPLLPNNLGTH